MLISSEYRELNRQLHENPSYGISGNRYASDIINFSKQSGFQTILDYGCGKGTFANAVNESDADFIVHEYDPAIAGKDSEPPQCDLVICTDVLEHIEPDYLDDVLSHMASKAAQAVFLSIYTEPAKKILSDGRNAHLIVEGYDWWMGALAPHFDVLQMVQNEPPLFLLVVAPKQKER